MRNKALPSTVEQKIFSCGWGTVRKVSVSGLGFPIHAAYTWLGHWPLFQVILCAGSHTRWFFFYVTLTEQPLLTISGIPAHCGFCDYGGNSRHIPGPRHLKVSQWLKMGLNLSWRYMNCESESKIYFPLWKKIVLSWPFHMVFSLGQCVSHAFLSSYSKSIEW